MQIGHTIKKIIEFKSSRKIETLFPKDQLHRTKKSINAAIKFSEDYYFYAFINLYI